MNKLSGWDNTIVALATPPGVGALGIVRLSGPRAIEIVNHLFPSKDLTQQASHTLHVGFLRHKGEAIDEVVVSLFIAPRSYTGEDVVEISCHGSAFVLEQVIQACIQMGARLAKPGEFTQRAFLQGKLDLAQAEAVADLIASNTAASQRSALHTMRGGFSGELKALRERLIRFSGLIELELDFSQEDVEFADRGQLESLIEEMQDVTSRLIRSFQLGNVIRNGVNVAIVGKPNAGKSTLLNSLLNENRAIVSEIPGTTRDTIEELLNIDGILFRLIDTAGIRAHAGDSIEKAGMARSREKMAQADLVLYVFDATGGYKGWEELPDSEVNKENYLLIGNKIDRVDAETRNQLILEDDALYISAKEGLNLDELRRRMVEVVVKGTIATEHTVVTNARHHEALVQVEASLNDIRSGLANKLPGDLLAADIRRALHYLGEITGEISNEDLLDYIFSKFCIGK